MYLIMKGQLQEPVIVIRMQCATPRLPQISLFLTPFWSTFPAKMEAPLHVPIRCLI